MKSKAKKAAQIFPLSTQHRDLAIVGLACHGTHARAIANAVEVDTLTVCEVLNSAKMTPILPPRTFRIEAIEWDTDGEVIERLPSEGTITVQDWEHWEHSDPEGAEYRALNEFSDLHGYCIEGSTITEVTGAAWPATPQEAEGLVESANWTGELRMGDGRYALVTHETLAHCYPEHLAYRKSMLLCDGCAEAGEWVEESGALTVINTRDAEGLQLITRDVLDLVSSAMDIYESGHQEAFDGAWEALLAMGLHHVQAPERRKKRRTFQLEEIKWKGRWKATRHLPTTSGEIPVVEFEDSPLSRDAVRLAVTRMFEKQHGCVIASCQGYEVFHV